MSHTQAVFERSYQTGQVRENLHRKRFEGLFPNPDIWDRSIELVLQDMTLKRDQDAPAEVSSKDLATIEDRKDVCHLREAFETKKKIDPRRDGVWRPLYMKYRAFVRRLSELAVVARRREYFEKVDRQRALGLPTQSARQEFVLSRCRKDTGPIRSLRLFFMEYKDKTYDTLEQQQQWIELVVNFLRHVPDVVDDDEIPMVAYEASTCLLCLQPLATNESLTKHVVAKHENQGTFSCNGFGLVRTTL
jgi:hypothetical protein